MVGRDGFMALFAKLVSVATSMQSRTVMPLATLLSGWPQCVWIKDTGLPRMRA